MKITAFVIAYEGMKYGRKPIKFLEKVGSKTVIEHTFDRLKKCERISEVILLTQERDAQIAEEVARKCGVDYFIGKGNNELLWVFDALTKFYPDVVILVSGGEPLIDNHTIELCINRMLESNSDFCRVVNTPDLVGFAPIIYSRKTLQKLNDFVGGDRSREWETFFKKYFPDVFPDVRYTLIKPLYFMTAHPNLFKCEEIEASIDEKGNRFWKFNGYLLVATNLYLPLIKAIYERISQEFIDFNEAIGIVEDLLYENQQWALSRYGLKINIEVTNECNLACTFCPRKRMQRKIGWMDFGLYKKIIDEASELPFNTNVDLTLYGEPLLHPKLLQMLEYADRLNFSINTLYTNGVLLEERIIKELLDTNVGCIYISLDAVNSEIYRDIKGKDEFHRVISNLEELLRRKKKNNEFFKSYKDGFQNPNIMKPVVALQIIELLENKEKIEDFLSRWSMEEKVKEKIRWNERIKETKDDPAFLIPLRYKLRDEYKNTLYQEFSPLEHVVLQEFDTFCGEIEDRSIVDYTPTRRFPCRQLQSLSILWNGDVVMCREDFNGKFLIGNLLSSSLREIWYSEELNNLRVLHKEGRYSEHPLCSRCKIWYMPVN